MNVPLLDLQAQLEVFGEELGEAVREVALSGRYIGGPKIEEIESAIAGYVGANYAIGVTSGTDALLVSLMALDVGPGDLVITTPYSFFATAGVIVRLGATPVFVDIDPVSYNIDPEKLTAWFDDNPRRRDRVKAIMPVHLYGQCAEMGPVMEVARRWGVAVVEDAAQALGATYPAERLPAPVRGSIPADGAAKAGAIGKTGCYSFYPSKNLSAIGDAGMVVTSDRALAEKIVKLRNHGAAPKYYHSLIGGNFRLDAIQAVALLVKLPHLESWHRMRRANAAYYNEHLNAPGVEKPAAVYGRDHHVYNQYVLRVPELRNELQTHLSNAGVGTEIYYPVPFHEQECFHDLGYTRGDFPESERAARETLAIPIYPEVSEEQKAYVVEKIVEFTGD